MGRAAGRGRRSSEPGIGALLPAAGGGGGQAADGRVVVGCNVENASYGLTLCAECGLVSALHGAGPLPDPQPRQPPGQRRPAGWPSSR